jgi:uncharacterized protein YneF (UPF0154 family)
MENLLNIICLDISILLGVIVGTWLFVKFIGRIN